MTFSKPWRSVQDQAQQLLDRGMGGDRSEIERRLECVSYYRLSGYWFRLYQPGTDRFVDGTTFRDVWDRYRFDRRLRLLVLDAVERVEVGLRSQIIHLLTKEYGAFALEDPRSLPALKATERYRMLANLSREYERSRELFIEDFRTRHGKDHALPPAWMLCELMSFGNLTYMYQGLGAPLKSQVAASVGVTTVVLDSWLRTLLVLRNVVAHHSRTWDRRYGYKPKLPSADSEWDAIRALSQTSLYVQLSVLQALLRTLAPSTEWVSRLEELIGAFPSVPIGDMGFPRDWLNRGPWRTETGDVR